MPAHDTTDEQIQVRTSVFLGGERVDIRPSLLADLDILEPAPAAHVCGAAGCRDDETLIRARLKDVGQRVLCPFHLQSWVEREVGGP